MTSCFSLSAKACLAFNVSGSIFVAALPLFFMAERAAFADFGLDLRFCCSASTSCFSLSDFFIASNLSRCSLRYSVRFFSSSGSIFDSANASAMASTLDVSDIPTGFDDVVGDGVDSFLLTGNVDTPDVPITEISNLEIMDVFYDSVLLDICH